MVDLLDVMNTLATQRSLYHSEADFQHSFAWEVHRRLPASSVRLERPIHVNGKTLHLDLMVQVHDSTTAVELKYKTQKLSLEQNDEEFRLANHSARDLGRYDFIKDIHRLENITSNIKNCEGWAILLTNDSGYWRPPSTDGTVDAAFQLKEARVLNGILRWGEHASYGTKRSREADLHLLGTYGLQWRDYATPSAGTFGQFRYLAVHVSSLG